MINPYDDMYFMKQALQEAQAAAEEGEIPVGAVITCQGKIIVRAHNQTERLNDVTAHAEMLAITAATNVLGAKYLTGCTLYVTVEPCIMCAGAIGWSQLSTVVYGACATSFPSESCCQERCSGRRMRSRNETFLSRKKEVKSFSKKPAYFYEKPA